MVRDPDHAAEVDPPLRDHGALLVQRRLVRPGDLGLQRPRELPLIEQVRERADVLVAAGRVAAEELGVLALAVAWVAPVPQAQRQPILRVHVALRQRVDRGAATVLPEPVVLVGEEGEVVLELGWVLPQLADAVGPGAHAVARPRQDGVAAARPRRVLGDLADQVQHDVRQAGELQRAIRAGARASGQLGGDRGQQLPAPLRGAPASAGSCLPQRHQQQPEERSQVFLRELAAVAELSQRRSDVGCVGHGCSSYGQSCVAETVR